jgi:hypothetical protein
MSKPATSKDVAPKANRSNTEAPSQSGDKLGVAAGPLGRSASDRPSRAKAEASTRGGHAAAMAAAGDDKDLKSPVDRSPADRMPAAHDAHDKAGDDFDIYLFLNDDKKELLRDPILQQMTVVRYEGEIDHATGFFHGYGKMVSTLGYTYSGQFVRGLMHGQGRISWSDGTAYEGEFVDNTISGNGKYSWANGDWYDGDVRLHVRHGTGKFYYKQLDETYEGEWREGLRHGKGTLRYKGDGSCEYKGDWVQDRRKGRGVMKYSDGGVYDGEWLDDVRHGQGTMTWRQNGVVVEEYRGSWVHGTPSGTGVSVYVRPPQQTYPAIPAPPALPVGADKSAAAAAAAAASALLDFTKDSAMNTYTGEYLDGKRHGFGTFVYDDGSRYEGQWFQNLKHGQGKYTSATGVVYVGSFVDGNPATPISDQKPETTVACPVPLYIKDVLAQTEANEAEAIIAVQSVISRNHGQLRRVFKYYAALETGVDVITTPQDWRASKAQGTMYLVQFLRMCSDCKLINQHLTIAAVDRLLLAFRDRHESTTPSAYLANTDVAPEGKSTNNTKAASPVTAAAPGSMPPAAGTTNDKVPTSQQQSPIQQPAPPPLSPPTGDASPDGLGGGKGRKVSASSIASGARREPGQQGAGGGKYASPWDRYRMELHNFVGELNFREFVEAVVRVAAALYRDPVYGSVANKVQIVLDDHLTAFACQPANGNPICRLGRDHRTTLIKYLDPLRRCFEYYARASALGTAAYGQVPNSNAAAASSKVKDVTVTVRQLALMLKNCGLLATAGSTDNSSQARLYMSDVHKALPYDKYPAFFDQMYRKAFVKQFIGVRTNPMSGLVGGPTAVQPERGGGGGGRNGDGSRPTASATPSHAPSMSVAPRDLDRQSTVSGAAPSASHMSMMSHAINPTLMGTIHSTSNSIQSVRDEEAYAVATAEAEAALSHRLAMQAKSRGAGGRSFRATVAMEVELTFAEFIEALATLAIAAFKENSQAQRISALMLNYVIPHEKQLSVSTATQ